MKDEPLPTDLLFAASDLIQRTRSDPTEENIAACKAWFDASPGNRKPFADAMFIADMPKDVRARIGAALGQEFEAMSGLPGGDAPEAQPGPDEVRAQPWGPVEQDSVTQFPSRRRVGRAAWIGAGAVAMAAVVAVAVGVGPNLVSITSLTAGQAEVFETGHGDIRTFSLPDGSGVTLDSDSRVSVKIDRAARLALLHQGRARFMVKADPRPFTIGVAGGEVTTGQGTVDVAMDLGRRADVRLRSGSGDVQGRDDKPRPLVIDQQTNFSQDAPQPVTVATPSVDTRDWPSGWAEYRTIGLGALIEEANRYAKHRIILDDPDLANLQASGRFKLTDTDKFVSRIAEPFGLKATRRSDGIHLSR